MAQRYLLLLGSLFLGSQFLGSQFLGSLFPGSQFLASPFLGSTAAADETVSYYKQVRPIFQARCQGCHQPAKASGDYVMTTFEQLLKGGESEETAIKPQDSAGSYLVDLITPDAEGKFEMPQGQNAKPLHETEIALIRRWIDAGAIDDTPANARQLFTAENPPQYSLPPVVSSLDFSPDGKLLAVTGFH